VITSLSDVSRTVLPDDEFHMTIHDGMNCEVIIKEKITIEKEINFIASFRFALEDGTCPGFHLTGIFANKDELPIEIKNAIMLDDLTQEQKKNFIKSVGVDLNNNYAKKKDYKNEFGDWRGCYPDIKEEKKSVFDILLKIINDWAKS
jgi:hypothetical protein